MGRDECRGGTDEHEMQGIPDSTMSMATIWISTLAKLVSVRRPAGPHRGLELVCPTFLSCGFRGGIP